MQNLPQISQPSRPPSAEEVLLYAATRRRFFCPAAPAIQPPTTVNSERDLRDLMVADGIVLRQRDRNEPKPNVPSVNPRRPPGAYPRGPTHDPTISEIRMGTRH